MGFASWPVTQCVRVGFPGGPRCAGPQTETNVGCQVLFPAQWAETKVFCPQPVEVTFPCLSPCLKNGELIYGCTDARSPVADWNELAHHLKPFFFPSNGLAGGPHCTRAVIRELVRVITRVLLSGSDKGWAGALRRGPGPRGPRVCEASPFGRSLHRQGRPRGAQGRAECGVTCQGPAWPHGALVGAAWASSGLPTAGPSHLPALLGRRLPHLLSEL